MGQDSGISWTHHTVNFWHGCQKVSPGCANCYAETLDARFHALREDRPGRARHWGNAPRLLRVEKAAAEARKYERLAVAEGTRPRVFTESMGDFWEDRAELDLARIEALEVIRTTPHLDWLILTKRPENVLALLVRALGAVAFDGGALADWLQAWLMGNAPANVWMGTTVEDQATAEERIPLLVKIPAVVRFLSCEPLLGPVDLECFSVQANHEDNEGQGVPAIKGLDWVIAGGESGPNARAMTAEWVRGLRDQAAAAGVPFHFKAWGNWGLNWMNDEYGQKIPGSEWMDRMGKYAAGRLLDGVEHSAFPEVPRG